MSIYDLRSEHSLCRENQAEVLEAGSGWSCLRKSKEARVAKREEVKRKSDKRGDARGNSGVKGAS